MQVFDGDIAYLHQAAIIAKSHDASLDNWAKEYYLASAADRYSDANHMVPEFHHPDHDITSKIDHAIDHA